MHNSNIQKKTKSGTATYTFGTLIIVVSVFAFLFTNIIFWVFNTWIDNSTLKGNITQYQGLIASHTVLQKEKKSVFSYITLKNYSSKKFFFPQLPKKQKELANLKVGTKIKIWVSTKDALIKMENQDTYPVRQIKNLETHKVVFYLQEKLKNYRSIQRKIISIFLVTSLLGIGLIVIGIGQRIIYQIRKPSNSKL